MGWAELSRAAGGAGLTSIVKQEGMLRQVHKAIYLDVAEIFATLD
jgi:hypothetical protein